MLAVFLDLETTGLDPSRHCVIDVAFKVADLHEGEIIDSYQCIVKQPEERWKLHDPKSLEINGYTWEQVCTGKDQDLVSKEIIAIFDKHNIRRGNSVFICQNPAFDRVFLTQLIPIPVQEKLLWPYHWLDLASMHWALLVEHAARNNGTFPKEMTLSKNEIAKQFGLPPETHPHRAMNGVEHLMECYEAVLGVQIKV